MDLELVGKRALVTGSSSDIGAEIARMLAAEGVAVVVHERDRARTQAVATGIEAAGGRAATALGDLTSDQGATAVIEVARQAFDGIDILVNNVGGSASVAHPTWFDAPLEEWAENYHHNGGHSSERTKSYAKNGDRGGGGIWTLSVKRSEG